MNVAPHDAESVANLFEEYHSKGKRKSGNVILQRVQFQNNVTHRVLLTGDPNNWGSAIERPNSEWSAYLRGTRPFRRSTEGSYTASSAYWKAGDRENLVQENGVLASCRLTKRGGELRRVVPLNITQ